MPARIVLLVTSPRLPVGLLTAEAWDLVRAQPVLTGAEGAWPEALRAAGARLLPPPEPPQQGAPLTLMDTSGAPSSAQEAVPGSGWVPALLAAAAEHGTVVWFAGPTGDPELARELGVRLARQPGLAELELVYGSWDPPGARLLDAVSVVDRLLSPGGDPWKQQQTHDSLARFLLEECYEAYDAIETGDLGSLREELGDLLLQVVLHARLAQRQPEEQRWSVDDVAADLVDKMIRRNPHVFAGVEVAGVGEIIDNWERIKQAEKPERSTLAGVARSQPALALAAKLASRTRRAGVAASPPAAPADLPVADADALGEVLLGVAAAASTAGVDAEAALRRAAQRYADRIQAAEAGDSDRDSGED